MIKSNKEYKGERVFKSYISSKGYKEKPTSSQSAYLNKMKFALVNKSDKAFSFDWIAEKLTQGHSITASLDSQKIRMVLIDIDDSCTIQEFAEKVKTLDLVPNLIYPTFSHSAEKHKFRAIYLLDRDITAEEYKKLQFWFEQATGIVNDKAMQTYHQLCHATNKKVVRVHNNLYTPLEFYPEKEIAPKIKEKLESMSSLSPTSSGKGLEWIKQESWSYSEGMSIYIALESHEYDAREYISFNSSDKTEEYFKAYDRAFQRGVQCERGSVGAKIFGYLQAVQKYESR